MIERTNKTNNNRRKFCSFCKEETEPDYKDVASLRRYISERGKIVNRTKSGVCFKHQRALGTAIKRGRYMALLPFSVSVR